ncbi:MAG: MBL fold metallo-hydrolase [Candidatus Saccharimonadales bacterium]
MNITKYVHSCLLVETPERVALFDPGEMSQTALPIDQIERLDDLIITHAHPDHYCLDVIQQLVAKFRGLVITAPAEVVAMLGREGIVASDRPTAGIEFFDSPHESVQPLYPQPDQIGVHYLDYLTHPGDSHSFAETKCILALPITAPCGSVIRALNLALELKPQYVVPIHDWHWRDEARLSTYENFEKILGAQGIGFLKPETGVALALDI